MLNFALVGCGQMAHWHAQELQIIPDAKVIALVDPIAKHTQEFRQKYFKAAVEFDSYDKLLAAPPAKLDAVVLVTPHSLHYPQAKAAMEHGVHVLVEKPMVTSSPHAHELWRTAKKTGMLLGITFQAPYSSNFVYLAGQRDAGALGSVQIISGWLSQSWLHGTARTWRQDPANSGGGQMYDSGAHLLNAAVWLMNDPVIQVGCFYNQCESPVDINGVVVARFQNGAIASAAIGGNCPAFQTDIQIQTDLMLIRTDPFGGKLEMFGRDGQRILANPAQKKAGSSPHANFVDAILGRQPLRATVRHGVLLSDLMDAVYESGRNGTIVKVKPAPLEI